jgi:D-3-phosphoglycerate dehydrogenase / 2-oxoglutarate reductase
MLRSGRPFPDVAELPLGLETRDTILGLVGLGRIGSRVATIARVLGMRVLAYDPFIQPDQAAKLGVELVPSLENLLPQAQVVSLHCPSLPATYHIMNAERLKLMPKGSYLINVARGALVDTDALLAALLSEHLAGAGLDVFDPEPPQANHPLFSLPNTICTPHIGSFTAASVERMQVMACEEIARVLRGEHPLSLVNADVWGQHRT